jgi:uncharacterized membrane protein (UPF0127 family)
MRMPRFLLLLLALLLAGCGGSAADAGDTTAEDSGEKTAAETTVREPGRTDQGAQTESGSPEPPTVTIHPSGGGEVEVRVRIADDIFERVEGLRGRRNLPENRGMLFVYTEEEESLAYTMEDTLVPLSIAFMDSEGRIVDIKDMEPGTEGPYVNEEPAQYALEVNQGFFEENGVEVGDRAELPG